MLRCLICGLHTQSPQDGQAQQPEGGLEAQDLARQKAALLAQLELIDRRQQALANAPSPVSDVSDLLGVQLPRIATRASERQSTVLTSAQSSTEHCRYFVPILCFCISWLEASLVVNGRREGLLTFLVISMLWIVSDK